MDKNTFIGNFSDIKTIKTLEKLLEWAEIANKFNKLLIAQGGFAVDLAVGRLTREHDDLDLICLEKDLNWFKERLEVDGHKIKIHEGHNPDLSFCAYKYNFILEDSIYLDFDGINIDRKVWDRSEGKKFVWPVDPKALFQKTNIDKIKIKFLNPRLVYEFKKQQQCQGWEKRNKEVHDFKILKDLALASSG